MQAIKGILMMLKEGVGGKGNLGGFTDFVGYVT
jgi:hypothetical protein